MSPMQLSLLAWGGGGVAGAVLAKEHRIAGGALGAVLVGAISDVAIERHQAGLPLRGFALTGAALGAITLWAIATAPKKARR